MFTDAILTAIIVTGLKHSEEPGQPGYGGNPCPLNIMALSMLIQAGVELERTNALVDTLVADGRVAFHPLDGIDGEGIMLTDAGREDAYQADANATLDAFRASQGA